MASAEGNLSQAERGICRLVEETSGCETIKILGPGCLSYFESVSFLQSVGRTPNSQNFLVASNQVLTKDYLKAIEDHDKEKPKKDKSAVAIFAEFPGTKNRSSLERKPLTDFYNSLENDVLELNGIIYICITKKLRRLFKKSSFLGRSLQASSFKEQTLSLNVDQLQCLVLCGETTHAEVNVATFSMRAYELLQSDSCLAADDAQLPKYFLRNEERKRFLQEDDFEKSEKPLGAVVLNKNNNLAGFLNFCNKTPAPVLVGILGTDSAKLDAVSMQQNEIVRELSVQGAPMCIYPPLERGVESEVGVDGHGKTSTDNTGRLTESTAAPVEAIVAQFNKTDLDKTAPEHQNLMFSIGGDEEEVPQDKDNQGPSPTENSYQSIQGPASTRAKLIVDLPPEDGKEDSILKVLQDNFASQRAVADGNALTGALNNNELQENQRVEFPEGYNGERRRHSFPPDPPIAQEEEHPKIQRRTGSDVCKFLPILREEKRKIDIGDPLAAFLGCLDLLEGLSRCLDKEYRYGTCKCWKHIAEFFDIEEEEYQNFECSEIHSPTEVMFEYLKSSNPEITIGMVKDGLHSIGRQDVIEVLIKYEQADDSVNNDTLVCSLFDSNPDIIGSMAFLLDRQKVGLKNWTHLAGKLHIPRSTFKSFETWNTSNPTEGLFELLIVRFPKMTVEELMTHLRAIRRFDVMRAIEESTKVKSGSLIKDLVGDLLVMDNVCELLNQKPRTNKVLGWKHLGARLKIDKDTLDDLSPPKDDLKCPTEALIRHLGSRMTHLTVADFAWALYRIDRADALAVLEVYLPDGCIQDFLRSCGCERC